MKVIQIYKPVQNSSTKLENLELVEYINDGTSLVKKIPHWCVKFERLKLDETYHDWILRKKEEINTRKSLIDKGVEGIYLHNVTAYVGIVEGINESNQTIIINKNKVHMMVRYDYIHKYEERT
jgi:hypothetical protein